MFRNKKKKNKKKHHNHVKPSCKKRENFGIDTLNLWLAQNYSLTKYSQPKLHTVVKHLNPCFLTTFVQNKYWAVLFSTKMAHTNKSPHSRGTNNGLFRHLHLVAFSEDSCRRSINLQTGKIVGDCEDKCRQIHMGAQTVKVTADNYRPFQTFIFLFVCLLSLHWFTVLAWPWLAFWA